LLLSRILFQVVLYAKRCGSESEESVVDVLDAVKSRFGTPSGITCDMRSGILSAAGIVFPHVPVRICLMHFLRDLGKDLMKEMHTDLGLLINRIGIVWPLRKILMNMPDYDQCTLYDVEYGFCFNREKMEIMAVKRVLENILSVRSSGYGFPFSLRHLNFFILCEEGMKKLTELSGRFEFHESVKTAETLMKQLSRINCNTDIRDKTVKLKYINSFIFQRIRKAFMIPDHGKLSGDRYDPLTDDVRVHENCSVVFGELEIYMKTDIENHLFRSAKLALFQNMDNGKYREIVFRKDHMGSVFSRYRKPFRKDGMTRKETMSLVDKGTDMILNHSLSDQPYTVEMINKSCELYTNEKKNGQ